MRVYLEAREIRDDRIIAPEFVRIDVTGKTQVQEQAILLALRDLMAGLTCQYSRHLCYHDEDKPCQIQEI